MKAHRLLRRLDRVRAGVREVVDGVEGEDVVDEEGGIRRDPGALRGVARINRLTMPPRPRMVMQRIPRRRSLRKKHSHRRRRRMLHLFPTGAKVRVYLLFVVTGVLRVGSRRYESALSLSVSI